VTALVVLEGVVIVLLVVLVVGLLRSHAEILRRLHDLGAGLYDEGAPTSALSSATATASTVPETPHGRTRPGVAEPRPVATAVSDLSGTTPTGAVRGVAVRGVEHGTLLAFLTSGCSTCLDFWQAFRTGGADHLPGRDTRLVIITKGPEEESQSAVVDLAPEGITTLMSSQAFADYGVPVSPYFILVDGPSGQVVGEGAAGSWPQVRDLLVRAAADAGMAMPTGESHDVAAAKHRAFVGGRQREAFADDELRAAGIHPGHESLYPTEPIGGAVLHDHDHDHGDHAHQHDPAGGV